MFTRKLFVVSSAIVLFAGSSVAQTQLVRGDVDVIQHTNPNQFRLDCTADVRLVSTTVNLQQLHDQSRQQDIEYEMQVRDVSSGGRTVLDVVSARTIPEQFDMGNLRFGRSETWETFASPGSRVWTFVNLTSHTTYFPFGSAGTWILGFDALEIAQGVTDGAGRFQFRFEMPNIPGLIGTSFSAQSIVRENGVFWITNADCKEVRS